MSQRKTYPPRLFLKFFRWYCNAKMQDLLAAVMASMIALLMVSYQAFKAAMSNPVTSLRSE